MLEDEEFSGRAKVDRYGRKLPKSAQAKDLERYYRLDESGKGEGKEDDERDEDEQVEREMRRLGKGAGKLEKEEEEGEESSSDDSSSDSESESESEEEEEVFGILETQDTNADGEGIPKGEVSSRLAVVNLDWDNIRAADLMAVFTSFVPSGGRIMKISIYPSEFGRERMEREEMEGPPSEIFGGGPKVNGNQGHDLARDSASEELEEDSDEDENIKKSLTKEDDNPEFNPTALRRYQLSRLRYFYAVITCSSPSVAQAIYSAVDGTEYLTTANFFDLRYIPDATDFSDDKPRDECRRIPDGYRPNEFVTDALQHSKVRLTWDAEDGERKEAQKRAFASKGKGGMKGGRKEMDENDLKAYLGSDSSDDEGEEAPPVEVVDATLDAQESKPKDTATEQPSAPKLSKKEAERQRMRALLGLSSEPAQRKSKEAPVVGDMQVTFSSGLDPKEKGSVFENTPEEGQETTVERYIRKEKERKARRKEKLKSGRVGDEGVDAQAQTSAADADGDQADADLGFDDPFFESAPTTKATEKDHATKTSKTKAEKCEKRKQREAEEAAATASPPTTTATDTNPTPSTDPITHFNIRSLTRGQTLASKSTKTSHKKKKNKLTPRDKEALEARAADTFEMDTQDPRFRDVFERTEYAIDPSHPRFLGTEGMERLLEEGRRGRVGEDGDGEGHGGGGGNGGKKGKRGRERDAGDEDGDVDVRRLVKRVKAKVKGN